MTEEPQVNKLPNFDTLWNYGKPAETRAAFLEILPRAEAKSDQTYLAELLTQIARTYSLEGKFDDAHTTLDRADALITNEMLVPRIRSLLERGRTYNSSGHPERALPLFTRAVDIGLANNIKHHAVDAIHMAAIAESDPQLQVEWNLKGIAIAEADETLHRWLWSLYNNIGESYLKLNNYDAAYTYFHLLGEYQLKKMGRVDIFTEKDKAKSLRLGGHSDRSLAIIEPVFEKLFSEQHDNGYIRQELAEALYNVGRVDEAQPHFIKAYELLSSDNWFVTNCTDELRRLAEMST